MQQMHKERCLCLCSKCTKRGAYAYAANAQREVPMPMPMHRMRPLRRRITLPLTPKPLIPKLIMARDRLDSLRDQLRPLLRSDKVQ